LTTETARVEAFSDGVFAIAITLLILEIKVPSVGSGDLGEQLLRQWPSYLSFFISFAYVGIMWINHHRLFIHIKKCDDVLLILNLLLLLGVTVVPFPTSVLAAHIGHPGGRTALIVYNTVYLVIAILFNVLLRYAASNNGRLLAPDVDRETVEKIARQYSVGPLLYLICIVLAWYGVTASLFINLALAFFFALPPRYAIKRLPVRRSEFS
jgi:uncharacterized membrane protein